MAETKVRAVLQEEIRREILGRYFSQTGAQPVNLTETDLKNAVYYTEDYSAFDLRRIVRECALALLRDQLINFCTTRNIIKAFYTTCSAKSRRKFD